jgi:bifunctional non-homologous end joining protein LigD
VPAQARPTGDAWLHEPKLDGYRLQILKEGRNVRLYSRRGYDWTKRLETVAESQYRTVAVVHLTRQA